MRNFVRRGGFRNTQVVYLQFADRKCFAVTLGGRRFRFDCSLFDAEQLVHGGLWRELPAVTGAEPVAVDPGHKAFAPLPAKASSFFVRSETNPNAEVVPITVVRAMQAIIRQTATTSVATAT